MNLFSDTFIIYFLIFRWNFDHGDLSIEYMLEAFYGESLRKLIQFQFQIFVCGYLEEEMDNNYYQDARRPNNWQVIIDMGIQYVYIYPSFTIELLYS